MADFNPNDRSTWPQWRLQAEQDRHERALHEVPLLLDQSEQPQTIHELGRLLLTWTDGPVPVGRHERAESMTSEELDRELIRTLSEQLRHLRARFPDEGAAVIALDVALDRWDDFVALTDEGGEQ